MYNQPYPHPPGPHYAHAPPPHVQPGYGHPPPHHMQMPPMMPPPQHFGGSGGGNMNFDKTSDRVIFIGNLPWDAAEAELGAHCATAGQVMHVRLATDQQTGKGKGFAFVEYRDALTAANAVRQLNNSDFRGRALRVDFSDPAHRGKKEAEKRAGDGGPTNQERERDELRKVFSSSGPSAPTPAAASSSSSNYREREDVHMADASAAIPTIPITVGASAPTVQPSAQPYGTDAISKLVTSLTKPQLLEILSEMKKFSAANPEGARQLLFDSPQVAQTLLHIMIMFGLVRPGDVANIQTMQRPVQGSMPPVQLPGAAPAAAYPPPAAAAAYPPPAAAYPPPPTQLAPPPAPPAAVAFTEEDRFMLNEIMKLSPEQIRQLPQEVQDKIRLLQQQVR